MTRWPLARSRSRCWTCCRLSSTPRRNTPICGRPPGPTTPLWWQRGGCDQADVGAQRDPHRAVARGGRAPLGGASPGIGASTPAPWRWRARSPGLWANWPTWALRGGTAGDVRCAWAVSVQQCCTLCVVDDLEPLTDAERKLLEAVQNSGLCDLSQGDDTDRTVRAAVLKAILSGEGEAWGIGAGAAINLHGAVVSGDLGGFDGSRLPPIRLESCRFEDSVDFSGATFTGAAKFGDVTFTDTAWFDNATFTGDAEFTGRSSPATPGSTRRSSPAPPGSTRRPSPATPGSTRRPSPATPGSATRPSPHRRVQRGAGSPTELFARAILCPRPWAVDRIYDFTRPNDVGCPQPHLHYRDGD